MENQLSPRDYVGCYIWIKGSTTADLKSKDELVQILHLVGKHPTKKNLKKYWPPGTKSLSFSNFVDILNQEPILNVEELLDAFATLGADSMGQIDYKHLMQMLTQNGEKMPKDDVQALFSDLVSPETGKVDYLHLCAVILSTIKQCRKVSLNKAEIGENQQKINSRTFTRTKGLSRPKTATVPREVSTLTPPNLQSWYATSLRGCFFIEDDDVVSHQFSLVLSEDSAVWITLQPRKILDFPKNTVDMELLVFMETEGSSKPLMVSTTVRDAEGRQCLRVDLKRGRYLLIPFTTGCYLCPLSKLQKERTRLLDVGADGSVILSTGYQQALQAMFELADLEGNGLLSRHEFELFILHTTGESPDGEWDIVEDHFETQNGQLTLGGFLAMHQMEARASKDNLTDLYNTLYRMGFNKDLIFNHACSFQLVINCAQCIPVLEPLPVSAGGSIVEKAICRLALEQGCSKKVRNLNDLTLYIHKMAHRASIVVQNKSHSVVLLKLDCSESQNCLSHRRTLNCVAEVPPHSCAVGHHLVPACTDLPWSVVCEESLIK